MPIAYYHFVLLLEAGVDEAVLTVTMRSLVEVHEIHVDGCPRNALIVLGSQVQKRLLQQLGAADPHFGRGEGVHPGDYTGNLVTVVDFLHDGGDFVRADCQILQYKRVRQNAAVIQGINHFLGVGFNFSECFFPVQMLRSNNEPELLVTNCCHLCSSSSLKL
ncbi:hypothetical protein D3C80_1500770 [compost metagenome]